jgi:dipeptidase D
MVDALARLEPRSLWSFFAGIAAIPRPSKHEERIASWIRALAQERGWPVKSDAVGNLVLAVPATRGREKAPAVVLQAHLDMVCEKNDDTRHDFLKDPIVPRVADGWVRATGTTLGADNGIGAAAALAAATDPAVSHGPLELLFTLDEETGLTGAKGLDGSMLAGRLLINMDSEEDGKLFVGCAGGADCHLFLEPARQEPDHDTRGVRVDVRGLMGGHSGLNIHENRGNALKLLTRVLQAAVQAGVDFELAEIAGGSKHNAIPREARAVLALAERDGRKLDDAIARMLEAFRIELAGIDDGLTVTATSCERPQRVMQLADRDRLLDLICVLPHGVLGMSPAIAGLVETSSNLAVVGADDGRIKIVTSCRSSVMPTLRAVLGSVRAAGNLAVAQTEIQDGYPGWKPDLGSRALSVTKRVYQELWGAEPEVTAVHAGLECGLLGEKVPGLDMISFGPEIRGAHSPDERVEIASVERFWKTLAAVLDRLSAS